MKGSVKGNIKGERVKEMMMKREVEKGEGGKGGGRRGRDKPPFSSSPHFLLMKRQSAAVSASPVSAVRAGSRACGRRSHCAAGPSGRAREAP